MTAKQLTDSILQMAIQGKLVPQDPNDEPASVLLERIREEKRRLVAEGKLKKSILNDTPIEESETPFNIPKGWVWCRLKSIFNMQAGKNVTSANIKDVQSDEYPYPCYGGNGQRGYVKGFNTDGEFPLIGRQGALCGNVNMAKGKFWATEHAVVTDGFEMTDVRWQYYFLRGLNLNKYATATAQPGLAVSKIIETLIPLPPLAEQKRIVKRIENFMPEIKELFEAYDEASKMDAELPDKLKKSILQEAIMGKLGTQYPSDAPAKCLLEDIRAEKQKLVEEGVLKKKDLVETPVEDDEVPFYIPDTWEWGRLGDFFTIGSGLSYKKEDLQITSDNKVRVLRGGNISFGDWCPKPDDIFIAKKFVADELLLKEWTFITPAVSSLEHMGKTALIRESYDNIVVGGFILMLFPVYKSRPFLEYLNFLFQSYYYRQLCQSLTNKSGQAFYNLSRTKLLNAVIPIPPVDEQIRIVKKVEELFGEIDNMTVENNININEEIETEKE
jgi:type I restriction enzyme S subunit